MKQSTTAFLVLSLFLAQTGFAAGSAESHGSGHDDAVKALLETRDFSRPDLSPSRTGSYEPYEGALASWVEDLTTRSIQVSNAALEHFTRTGETEPVSKARHAVEHAHRTVRASVVVSNLYGRSGDRWLSDQNHPVRNDIQAVRQHLNELQGVESLSRDRDEISIARGALGDRIRQPNWDGRRELSIK